MAEDTEKARILSDAPAVRPAPFLLDAIRLVLGDTFSTLNEGTIQRPTNETTERPTSPTVDGFAVVVSRALRDAPVFAIPRWDRERNPPTPAIGQVLVEKVSLSDQPFGLLIPIASLSSLSRSNGFRKALLQHERSLFVLEAQGALENVHSAFRVAFVALHRELTRNALVTRFVRVPPRNREGRAVLDDIRRLLKMPGGVLDTGFVHRNEIDPFAPLTYEHYDPALRERKSELRSWGSGGTLREMFEIQTASGAPLPAVNRDNSEPRRYVSPRSIGTGGRLEISQTEQPQRTATLRLQAGDLVMPAPFHHSDTTNLRVAEVSQEDLPLEALPHVLVLRPTRELSEAERLLLVHYLRSSLAKQLVSAAGATNWLIPSALQDLYVPIAESSLLEAVASIADAHKLLKRWGEEAVDALDSIFALESPTAARAALIERGRDSRLRVDAARNTQDFDYRVRTLYPYPVAYRWRSIDSIASKGEAQETLREVRHGFEHIIAFAGCVAAAVARKEEVSLPELRSYGATDEYRTYVTTWTRIFEQVARRVDSGQTHHPLLIHLRDFHKNQGVGEAIQRLIEYRRAESHTLETSDEEGLASQLLGDVKTLLHGLRFLADYELIEIVDTRWDSILRRNTIRYKAMMGDHPIVPVRTIVVDDAEIEQESLYLRVRDSKETLVPLRPYLLGRRCKECKQWATYYLHATMGRIAKIKSIEHGHPNDLEGLPDVLRSVAAGLGDSGGE